MAVCIRQRSSDEAECVRSQASACCAFDIPDPDTPESILAEAETSDLIRDAIGGLTRDHQQILALRFQDDLTFEAIGARLGITKQSAQAKYALAIERMRTSLSLMGINQRKHAA
jgi:RNA polymerase sigma factor (sigma-70 family)